MKEQDVKRAAQFIAVRDNAREWLETFEDEAKAYKEFRVEFTALDGDTEQTYGGEEFRVPRDCAVGLCRFAVEWAETKLAALGVKE